LSIELGSQRYLFEVPDEVAYFNTANMSPLLHAVREAGDNCSITTQTDVDRLLTALATSS